MTMQEVITWLRGIEDLACSIYSEVAESDAVDNDVADFLRRLAEDEALHYHLMGSAAEFIRSRGEPMQSAVLVDAAAKKRVEGPLRNLHARLQQNQLTERTVMEALVEAETSEWNEIFLYVVNSFMEISPTFQYMAATIQAHEKLIEERLAVTGNYGDLSKKLSSLKDIWNKRLLVVDDEKAVRSLLVQALSRYGQVTAVENGELALAKIRESFFNVVVTDVDMPVRDGISLLREAIRKDDFWRMRFIVCTGNPNKEIQKATRDYGVTLLEKPIPLRNLWEAVDKVLAGGAPALN